MNTYRGDNGPDILIGTNGNDRMFGYGGDDWLIGLGGNDTISGGRGNDFLLGNRGADDLRGEAGNDVIVGGAGDDALYGGIGRDILWGQEGRDHLFGGDGCDWLFTDSSGDDLHGGRGNDTVTVAEIDTTISPNNSQPGSSYAGDGGFDTLRILSNARWEGPRSPYDFDLPWLTDQQSFVRILLSDRTYVPDAPDTMTIGSWDMPSAQLRSTIDGFERIEVLGDVRFQYVNERDANMQVVGTGQDDAYWTGRGSEVIHGGAGNDEFYLRLGGNDTIYTGLGSDDLYVNEFLDGGRVTIRDFTVGQDNLNLQAPSGTVERTPEGTLISWDLIDYGQEALGSVFVVGVQLEGTDFFGAFA